MHLSRLFLLPLVVKLAVSVGLWTGKRHFKGRSVAVDAFKQVHEFTGIPYAKPPVGPLRLSSPQPHILPSIINATNPGNLCPALNQQLEVTGAEDCLTLDIFIPGDSSPRIVKPKPLYPVLVWFVGEGLDGPRDNVYPVQLVAHHKLIIVVVRYRSGPLGFLHHSIFGDNLTEKIGNIGLLDQREALRWVSEYIEEFGGDSGRVTVMGQSITASYLLAHVKDLYKTSFHQMILHGSPMSSSFSYWTDSQSNDITSALLDKIDCGGESTLACLRERSVEEILRANNHITKSKSIWDSHWRPTVGSPLLDNSLHNILRSAFLPPMLLGSNAAEGGIFSPRESEESLESVISGNPVFSQRNDNAQNFVNFQYAPSLKGDDDWQSRVDFVGDSLINCPTNSLADLVSRYGRVYRYVFGYQEVMTNRFYSIGVTHGDETKFLSGEQLARIKAQPYNSLVMEAQFTTKINSLIASFVESGDPTLNVPDITWPQYNTTHPVYLKMGDGISTEFTLDIGFRGKYCSLWNDFLPSLTQTACSVTRSVKTSNSTSKSLNSIVMLLLVLMLFR